MTREEQIEKEREKNDWLALEIERVKKERTDVRLSGDRGDIRQSMASFSRGLLMAMGRAGELRELERQKKESDQRLAALKRNKQGSGRSEAGLTQSKSESVSVHDKKAEPVQETVDRAITTKRPRGPKPKMEYHGAIAAIVDPFGDPWKSEHNLQKIVKELDRDKAKTPPVARWADRKPAARSWGRALEYYPERVIEAISYSLKMARRVSAD